MKTIFPDKLQKGDEVRVIAPSRTHSIISKEVRAIATANLEKLGLKVTFSKNVEVIDEFTSSSIEARLEDLHEAFRDSKVKAILSTIGGFNANQLLPGIDFDLIKDNPKVLCGYSDVTILLNAIFEKTGMVSYYGPHYSTFGVKKGNQYTIDHFQQAVFSNAPIKLVASEGWSDDEWYLNQDHRGFMSNPGFKTISAGTGKGTIIGGNLDTFNLLQGTSCFPQAEEVILFLEEDNFAGENFDVEFDRNLESVLQQTALGKIKGLVLGRCPKDVEINFETLTRIIANKPALKGIPIVSGVDFGHTLPMATIPIGATASLEVQNGRIEIQIANQ